MQNQASMYTCRACGWTGDVSAYAKPHCPRCYQRRNGEWREKNRERYLENLRQRRREFTDEDHEKERTRKADLRLAQRIVALRHYGGDPPRCACCGEDNWRFLSLDHINGGGLQHKRETNYGDLARWLIANGLPKGFRVLCYNCNFALGHYGFCPHALLPAGQDADRAIATSARPLRPKRGRPRLVEY